ncbi:MAG: lysine biosynthesis enzyme LysX [Euryarchaeota archaeon RBG_16_68_13]|nr:MAG: lysine biosynthesis enzyme LysX [Euryarchaeota archaeon RBG_16_68_13]
MVRIGLLYTQVRQDERLLLEAARRSGDEIVRLRDADLVLSLQGDGLDVDAVLNRCMSHSRSLYCARFLEHHGFPVVNASGVIGTCGDKALTSVALAAAGVPTPRTLVAFSPEAALRAIESIGYPAVLKPVVGSWGRLVSKVSNREQAEQLLEHKATLGHYMHHIFYVQEYVDKPSYDIRSHVIGDRVTSAIRRESSSWITNAARGAVCTSLPVTRQIEELSLAATRAVGGGVLGVDLMPDREGRLFVHEVNHTMEFKASVAATGFDLPGAILAHVREVARR